uniref:Uncharacterized protein n=1 Tax=Desertifilum tharense IPPAS B-1220 TaxID=1781255 RepID=A0ACD5GY52_9CYAN
MVVSQYLPLLPPIPPSPHLPISPSFFPHPLLPHSALSTQHSLPLTVVG